MKLFSRHMILSGRILAITFILANSGFTMVLRQCTMKSDAPMECCSSSDNGLESSCDGAKDQGGLRLTGVQFTCYATTIIGGSATSTAVLEKESAKQTIKTGEFYACYQYKTSNTSPINCLDNSVHLTSTLPPPSVEKCLLNSTLLI